MNSSSGNVVLYWGVSVLLFVCSECLICVHAVFAILRLRGRPGRDDSQRGIVGLFGGTNLPPC